MLEELYHIERMRIACMEIEKDGDLEHPVFGEGASMRPLIMFVGEAPGREEAECGRPFVGKAGRQLDAMLELAGIDRNTVFVTNTVKYRPIKLKNGRASNRTPSDPEIRDGACLLRKEVACVRPYVIATLGNVPLKAMSLIAEDFLAENTIGAAHGVPGVIMVEKKPYRFYPLYHPAAAIYNRELKPVLEHDLIELGRYCSKIERDDELI